jgi:hypothetical protein
MSQQSYETVLSNLEHCQLRLAATTDLMRQIIKENQPDPSASEEETADAAARSVPRLWTNRSMADAVFESLRRKSPQLIGELLDHAEELRPGTSREAGALLIGHLVKKGKLEQDDAGLITVRAAT